MTKYLLLSITFICCASYSNAQICQFQVDWQIDNTPCPTLGMTIIPQAGTAPYSVQLSSGASYNISLLGQPLYVLVPPATFSITVTDNAGLICAFNFEPYLGPVVLGPISEVQPSCPLASDGQLSVNPTGGYGTALTTQWTGTNAVVLPGTTIQNLNADLYNVVATDVYGCSATSIWNLEADPDSDITVTSVTTTDAGCMLGGSIEIEVDGSCAPYEFIWSNGALGEQLTNLVAGDYEVTVTDCWGCSIVEQYQIQEIPELLMAYDDIPDCLGDITVTGGCFPYTFYLDGVEITQNTPICTVPLGPHEISVTDGCGCSVEQQIDIQAAVPISIVLDNFVNPGCLGDTDGSIDLFISGGSPPLTYLWSNGVETEDLVNLAAGTYTVTVTDDLGNSAESTFELIEESFTDLEFTNSSIIDFTCDSEGSIILETTGGCEPISFTWNNGATGSTINNLLPGEYVVTITDCTGCGIIESFTVLTPAPLNLDIESSPGCIDAINVSGGCPPYMYDAGGIVLGSFPMCDLAAGTYSITVTDDCACSTTESVMVEDGNPIVITLDSIIVAIGCNGADDGAIDISVSGGEPAYTFFWSNGALTEDIQNLSAGTYIVTVTDALGASAESTFEVESEQFEWDYEITCESNLGQDGNIELSVTSDNGPYTYIWSNGVETPVVTGLGSGLYTVTVISDISGCEYLLTPFFVCHDSMALNMDTLVCAGTEVFLDAQFDNDIEFISWQFIDTNEIECDTCAETSVFPHESRTYGAIYSSPTLGTFAHQFDINVIDGCVWPGDTDSSTVVDQFDLFPICLAFGQTGPVRAEQGILWQGYPAEDYGMTMAVVDIDIKHADCDGNGTIELTDTTAIIDNWGETHKSIHNNVDGVPIYVQPDSIFEAGAEISLPIIVGVPDTMAVDVYGIGFSILFDPEIMVDGTGRIALTDSWFSAGTGEIGIVQKEFAQAGRLDFAIARTDLQNVSGSGQVANFIIIMEDDILKVEEVSFDIEVANIRMIENNGKEIPASGLNSTSHLIIDDPTGITQLTDGIQDVSIYPNPYSGDQELHFKSELEIETCTLLDLHGRIVMRQELGNLDSRLIIPNTTTKGVYFLKFEGKFGAVVKKLIVK